MFLALAVWQFSLSLPLMKDEPLRHAITAAVPQLLAGARGHAEQKVCFACHNQAFPMLALTAARDRGYRVPDSFFTSQVEQIAKFLESNKKKFRDGQGTGGQAATAAYALFTLQLAGYRPDDTTAAVAEYLLKFEPARDHWRTNSHRPPTESSDFTTTYLTMRVLRTYGAKADKEKIEARIKTAREWLLRTEAKETEARVFRLFGLKEAGASDRDMAAAAWELLRTQQANGGWSQLDGGACDAYATGSSLYALHHAGGLKADAPAFRSGVAFLLKTQLPDGTWFVKSRSKPFQPYYESGFPHEKDQFISIAASGWATAALAAR